MPNLLSPARRHVPRPAAALVPTRTDEDPGPGIIPALLRSTYLSLRVAP